MSTDVFCNEESHARFVVPSLRTVTIWALVLFAVTTCIGYTAVRAGGYYEHLERHRIAHRQARGLLESEVCQNPVKRAEINAALCDEAEITLATPLKYAAITDTLGALHVCRDGYCFQVFRSGFMLLLPMVIGASVAALFISRAFGINLGLGASPLLPMEKQKKL